MAYFLSCDWGTSAFRLRLVTLPNLTILAEITTNQGIAATFQSWRESHPAVSRVGFYQKVILAHIRELAEKVAIPLVQVPVVLSGMASASIGMQELPYQEMPFGVDGAEVITEIFPPTALFPHQLLLISGVKSEHDVMRGEETQLIGMMPEPPGQESEQVFIFPGTHSKHIWVRKQQAVAFKTYMTGEIFSLLAQKSILSTTVATTSHFEVPAYLNSFKQGVKEAVNANLLHAAFRVRTNQLFGKLDLKENFSYLSGLVIGTELKDLQNQGMPIRLVAGQQLQPHYTTALAVLGLAARVQTYPARWVDEAVVRGQYQIFQQLVNR